MGVEDRSHDESFIMKVKSLFILGVDEIEEYIGIKDREKTFIVMDTCFLLVPGIES